VCTRKHEGEQASIMREFNRTYKVALELMCISENVIVYIHAIVIARVRFGDVHTSGVYIGYLKPHGSV
jgi:hypothetical protein